MVFKGLPVLLGKTIYDEMSSYAFISLDPEEARTSTDKGGQDVVLPGNAVGFHFEGSSNVKGRNFKNM